MGFTLPPRMNNSAPADHVRSLMARKDALEDQLETQLEILQSHSVTMDTPLVDAEGFPRADIDIWAVRHARVRIIELRNDLKALMDKIMVALQDVYDPSTVSREQPSATAASFTSGASLEPFARVDGVAPGSPAASAGLLREDLILSFGPLDKSSFPTSSSLQPLAELVAAQENNEVVIEVLRSNDQRTRLTFIPRRGWGGRGLLGCHLVPYTA
ncbi:hypothetical protein K466DRAFT_521260 [Polyporus arcularius HHB13444]|uniref:Probable 26S proteasome regulatory subunit p27 n=1 Tax=Polyporus arcularius HHB13444 TaxID=1314778 RepID=A0A5C3PEN3_9APHY|nr:hypothetical protein K466DRAFT_521260 [Polyporus arcularius HHB13444]